MGMCTDTHVIWRLVIESSANCSLEHGDHIKHTRLDDLEPKEAESKGEKVGEVGVGWGCRSYELMGRGQCQIQREHPRGWPGENTGLRPPLCWTASQEGVLG